MGRAFPGGRGSDWNRVITTTPWNRKPWTHTYTLTRVKQNERGCPNRRPEIYFWEERTSKTRLVDQSGLPKLKILTSVKFFGQARLLLQHCEFWWWITTSSLQKERSSIFCGLSTFKSISEALEDQLPYWPEVHASRRLHLPIITIAGLAFFLSYI